MRVFVGNLASFEEVGHLGIYSDLRDATVGVQNNDEETKGQISCLNT